MTHRLLLVKEAAAILRIPLSRAYALIRAGQLPAVFLGARQVRVPQDRLEAFIAGGGIKAITAPPSNVPQISTPTERGRSDARQHHQTAVEDPHHLRGGA
jgi:excisionase family DNA binding protein